MRKAIQITEPTANVEANLVRKVFHLVFDGQWRSVWEPSRPVEKERRLEYTSIQIGIWRQNLPSNNHIIDNSYSQDQDDQDDQDFNTTTPRKRSKMAALATANLHEILSGSPVGKSIARSTHAMYAWFHL